MNAWSWVWLFWVAQFLGFEFYALNSNAADTLSEQTWHLEDLNKVQPFDFAMWTDVHWAVALIVWLLFLWLSFHIPFGLFR